MYTEANFINRKENDFINRKETVDNVINIVEQGCVVVCNVAGSQVYDIRESATAKQFVRFENNWNEGVLVLTVNNVVVDSVNYKEMSQDCPEYKNLIRLHTACVKRCREQPKTDVSGSNVITETVSTSGVEHRKNLLRKFFCKEKTENHK